ncbi:hypothetical protein Rsub_00131 [Raphidocelis subcapitata]|uniref:Uncharacterized protein n=1 Tax=Raphidocelis subcapitata TaxID=307507 RepID=A0A2V0NPJ2_9CHLO|nr:hypothetical protein Rsub_00131 [Raphidocelis subcapitata]|eukprot:GBF87420.1 hypothetical protein Rsub_00131 [Raphidocelis subcapitata]
MGVGSSRAALERDEQGWALQEQRRQQDAPAWGRSSEPAPAVCEPSSPPPPWPQQQGWARDGAAAAPAFLPPPASAQPADGVAWLGSASAAKEARGTAAAEQWPPSAAAEQPQRRPNSGTAGGGLEIVSAPAGGLAAVATEPPPPAAAGDAAPADAQQRPGMSCRRKLIWIFGSILLSGVGIITSTSIVGTAARSALGYSPDCSHPSGVKSLSLREASGAEAAVAGLLLNGTLPADGSDPGATNLVLRFRRNAPTSFGEEAGAGGHSSTLYGEVDAAVDTSDYISLLLPARKGQAYTATVLAWDAEGGASPSATATVNT